MIDVLIVDDSAVLRQYLAYLLGTDPDIRVVGQVCSGEEALKFVARRRPDVITMDMAMPGMDGFVTTRQIMETTPVPIVIVSASWLPGEVEKTFKALEAGAVSVLAKPKGPSHPETAQSTREFIQTIKLMAKVPVVRRWSKVREPRAPLLTTETPVGAARLTGIRMVAIGASTGGPPVLQTLLTCLPVPFPVPMLVVQHIAAGFTQGMVDWLQQTTKFTVVVARHGIEPEPGSVYFAPDGSHLGLAVNGTLVLSKSPPDNGLRPSVAHLFTAVADVYGQKAAAVLLTGMGQDGAKELKRLHTQGAVTIVQDKESAVVFGMPGEAVKLGAATYVLPPEEIAKTLQRLVGM